MILQLLNAAAGKDCSKDSDELAYEAYLLMTKHSGKDRELNDSWSTWEGQPVRVVPHVETIDTLRTMQVSFVGFGDFFFPVYMILTLQYECLSFSLATLIQVRHVLYR